MNLVDGIVSKKDLSAKKLLPEYIKQLNEEIENAIEKDNRILELWYFPEEGNWTSDDEQDMLVMFGDNVNGYDNPRTLTIEDTKRVIETIRNNGFYVERYSPSKTGDFARGHGKYVVSVC